MRSQPLITVLMSVLDEDKNFLKTAIESILHQTYNRFEFLIIDDGSTNKACRNLLNNYVLEDTRVRLITNENNLGLTASLNLGVQHANGKYIARIDSNDIAHPTRLAKQLDFMEKHPAYALCGSWAYLINEDDEIVGKKELFTSYEAIRKHILNFNIFTHSSLFFKKDTIVNKGGYTPTMKKAQDYDLILKLAAKHPIANLSELLCFYRISPKSISEAQYKKQESFAVKARLRAITHYGYGIHEVFKIILPLLSLFLIPTALKKYLISFSWHTV